MASKSIRKPSIHESFYENSLRKITGNDFQRTGKLNTETENFAYEQGGQAEFSGIGLRTLRVPSHPRHGPPAAGSNPLKRGVAGYQSAMEPFGFLVIVFAGKAEFARRKIFHASHWQR
jgi:hypothetical protein